MKTRIALTVLLLSPAIAAAQTPAPIAFAKASDAFVQGLDAICKPWMAGEDRKVMGDRLRAAGWGNSRAFRDIIFTAEGPWGEVMYTAADPKEGRDCTAIVTIKEMPWSTAAARDAASVWADANIGGTKQNGTVNINGKPGDVWVWTSDARIARLLQYREPQASGGDVNLFIVPPTPKPAPAPPSPPGAANR